MDSRALLKLNIFPISGFSSPLLCFRNILALEMFLSIAFIVGYRNTYNNPLCLFFPTLHDSYYLVLFIINYLASKLEN